MNRLSAIPLSVRIIALLDIFVKAPVVLLGALSGAWHHSPALLLGLLIPSRIAPPLLMLLAAGSLTLAIATLVKKPWGLDGLVVYAVFALVNAPLTLFSRARLTYEALMARRMVMDSRIPVDTAVRIQQLIFISIYVIAFIVAALFLYFLLTRRSAFRAACAAHASNTAAGSGL
jgi:hypothetical protein